MRKYHNAIQHGAYSRPITPPILRVGNGQVYSFFEKGKTQAKKDGQLDEHEADPISFHFTPQFVNKLF